MYQDLKTITDILGRHMGAPIGWHRFFSVLIPFVERDGELFLLFEVRAKDMASDPGEICFPGGHVESGEDPADCAVRETVEETGIPAEEISLCGQGKILYGFANYTMYTYYGKVSNEAFDCAKPNEKEVDSLFLLPLARFFEEEPQVFTEKVFAKVPEDFPYAHIGIDEDYRWREGRWEVPIYDVDGSIVWGLTARIVKDLVDTLKASEDVFTD